MLIAHAPAAYLLATLLCKRLRPNHISPRQWAWLGGGSGLLPDADMLYFYAVDHGQVHHHHYITHWPVLWLLLALGAGWCWQHRPHLAAIILLLALSGLLHMLLDSIAGDIGWGKPWLPSLYSMVAVPARHSAWWLNFILHWTFLLEIALCLCAIWHGYRQSNRKRHRLNI